MLEMYEKYGYYKDAVIAVAHKGIEGLAKIKSIMENLRNNPPKTIGDYKVLKTRDYDKDEIVDLATGEKTTTGIPKSNVLYYEMEGDAWLAVRPSGTEPKIKLYYGVVGDSLDDADKKSVTLGEQVKALLDSL
ncbi:MAG: phospho-sugar mutase, partial [Eubacterium sp.]|nr:phospho-sugar mutase [Eubacterium sp.]